MESQPKSQSSSQSTIVNIENTIERVVLNPMAIRQDEVDDNYCLFPGRQLTVGRCTREKKTQWSREQFVSRDHVTIEFIDDETISITNRGSLDGISTCWMLSEPITYTSNLHEWNGITEKLIRSWEDNDSNCMVIPKNETMKCPLEEGFKLIVFCPGELVERDRPTMSILFEVHKIERTE